LKRIATDKTDLDSANVARATDRAGTASPNLVVLSVEASPRAGRDDRGGHPS